MFAKKKEKIKQKIGKLKRFLRNLELPFPDANILTRKCENTITKDAILASSSLLKRKFKLDEIDLARREIYKGGKISWRLMRWGVCPTGAQGIRIRLDRGLFRDHFFMFPDLTRTEQELKYRKVLFK